MAAAAALSILSFAPCLRFAPCAIAQTAEPRVVQPSEKPAIPELRGLWVVRTNLTSPQSIRHVVDLAQKHHYNALFVQVRGRGDAFYQSTLEPRSEELDGTPVDFDPLGTLLPLAHHAGLQVHAWVNSCYVWGSPKPPRAKNHIVNAHRDWLCRDAKGSFLMTQGKECEGAFLSPANPAARKHIHDVLLDLTRRYDIDGIHLDYIRYPNLTYDYSSAALQGFQQDLTPTLTPRQNRSLTIKARHDRLAYVHAFPGRFADFRRRQVTELVRSISQDVKAVKPWVVMSAAVFADSKDAYIVRGQDWKTWLRLGYLDAVAPMAYGVSTPKVAQQIADAVKAAHDAGKFAYAGIGAWHISAESAAAKINTARALGAQGSILFSYGGVTKDGANDLYLDALDKRCYTTPATLPIMTWLPARDEPQATARNY